MILQHILLDEVLDTLVDENPLKLDLTRTKEAYFHEAAMVYSYVYTYTPPPGIVISDQAVADLAFAIKVAFEMMHDKTLPVDVVLRLARSLMENTRAAEQKVAGITRVATEPIDQEEGEKSLTDIFNNIIDDALHDAKSDELPEIASSKKDAKWKLN